MQHNSQPVRRPNSNLASLLDTTAGNAKAVDKHIWALTLPL